MVEAETPQHWVRGLYCPSRQKPAVPEQETHLVVVLIEHDDDLCHVVEFRDGSQVVHGSLPLLVLLLLRHRKDGSAQTQRAKLGRILVCLRPAGLRI